MSSGTRSASSLKVKPAGTVPSGTPRTGLAKVLEMKAPAAEAFSNRASGAVVNVAAMAATIRALNCFYRSAPPRAAATAYSARDVAGWDNLASRNALTWKPAA